MSMRLWSFRPSRTLPHALALLVPVALGGCGGGGGGPSIFPPPFGSGYPALANATSAHTGPGISTTYTRETANEFDPVSSSVVVEPNQPGQRQITVTVSGVPVPGGTEDPFSFVVDTEDLNPLSISPLSGCANCLTTGIVAASDNKNVTFIYLDPAAAGLTYSTLGLWSKPAALPAAAGTDIGGAFSLGVVTRGNDLPTSGTAIYKGFFVGRYATSVTANGIGPGIYAVGANATADVAFGPGGSVDFKTLNTQIRLEGAGGALGAEQLVTHLNLNATGLPITVDRTTNSFSGDVATAGNILTGTLTGAFYGRPVINALPMAPPEMGGVVSVTNRGTQTMVGGFALKVQ